MKKREKCPIEATPIVGAPRVRLSGPSRYRILSVHGFGARGEEAVDPAAGGGARREASVFLLVSA
jgi:hypothetical protein